MTNKTVQNSQEHKSKLTCISSAFWMADSSNINVVSVKVLRQTFLIHLAFILPILFIGQGLWSQITQVDSLSQILEKEDLQDSTRIRISFEIINLIYYKDIPKCKAILKNLDEIIRSSSIENKFKHKFSLARAYSQTHKPDSAQIIMAQGAKLISIESFPREFAQAQSLFGSIQKQKRNLSEALEHYQQALPIFFELQDSFPYAATMNNIGIVYNIQANYVAALESFLKALSYFQDLNRERAVKATYKNIGAIKKEQKSLDEALEYYKKSLAISQSSGNIRAEAKDLNDIGSIYIDIDQLDSASHYLHQSATLYEGIENDYQKVVNYNNLGLLYRLLKDYKKGIEYNTKALEDARKVEFKKPLIFALLELGLCHQNLSNFSKANTYFNQALDVADDTEDISLQFEIENALYNLHRKTNVTKALGHYERAIMYKDSMFNKSKTEELKTVELNYEFDKERILRDQEIKTLQVEDELKSMRLKSQKNTILYLILFLLAAVALSYLLWNNIKKNKALALKENTLQKQRIIRLEKEKKILSMSSMIEGQESERKRIAQDLHDGLGGLLATIKVKFGIIQKEIAQLESMNVYQQTTTMIDNACTEVRKIAHNMMPDSLTKLGLIEAVRDIAEYTTDLDIKVINLGLNTITETQEIMLYRVIQEFLNNSRKHAQAEQVIIQFSSDAKQNIIYLEDDGNGFDINMKRTNNGLGLSGMESRINYLDGAFLLDSVLGSGTTLEIKIPQ